jgi:hypothetical protein
LNELEVTVLEDNVVEWVVSSADVEDKPTAFNELMGHA